VFIAVESGLSVVGDGVGGGKQLFCKYLALKYVSISDVLVILSIDLLQHFVTATPFTNSVYSVKNWDDGSLYELFGLIVHLMALVLRVLKYVLIS